MTDVGVETVVGASRGNITWLDLTGCESVTSAGLEKIAAGCPSLASLNLAGAPSPLGRGEGPPAQERV
jgi:hypothetical protein